MSKPAARMGDPTIHGGSIILGFPTVLIGGQPAARVSDMHVCPMATPGTPPIPHVGGPISLGSFTVLIGGMPAARMGDMAICTGPPDSIAMGFPTVLIGDAGSGSSGSASGGGGGGAGAAHVSAATAVADAGETVTFEEHWVRFRFVDSAGLPVSGVAYAFEDPSGAVARGYLRLDGCIQRDGLDEGTCRVKLLALKNASWSEEEITTADAVNLSVDAPGFEDGSDVLFQIYRRDIRGPDTIVTEIRTTVSSEKADAQWSYQQSEDSQAAAPKTALRKRGYSTPVYFFEVIAAPCRARSGLLRVEDTAELNLKTRSGQGLKNEKYFVYLPNGEVRGGTLDSDGKLKLENVPPGAFDVRFPELERLNPVRKNSAG